MRGTPSAMQISETAGTGKHISTAGEGCRDNHCCETIIIDKMTKKIDNLQLNMIKLIYREIMTNHMII